MKKFGQVTGLIAVIVAAMAASTVSYAQSRTEVGSLECFVVEEGGFIFSSRRDLNCTFRSIGGGADEPYIGQIRQFGLDIGSTNDAVIEWIVLAPTSGYTERALVGQYVGAGAEATLGLGLGANVLIGGSDETIALQPLSLQAQTGLNLAIGVRSLTLR